MQMVVDTVSTVKSWMTGQQKQIQAMVDKVLTHLQPANVVVQQPQGGSSASMAIPPILIQPHLAGKPIVITQQPRGTGGSSASTANPTPSVVTAPASKALQQSQPQAAQMGGSSASTANHYQHHNHQWCHLKSNR